ncbi:MAG: histidine kinase, partial [Eubacteriales bacterium]
MKMNRWNSISIQVKFMLAFAITSLVVLISNVFLFNNINTMLSEIDQVYQSNSNLNELSDALTGVQENLEKYLSDKSSETLEAYYDDEQNLLILTNSLNDVICDDELLMMERNIRNMITEYLIFTNDAISAKRGRNVELYRTEYEEANTRYEIILPYIVELNNSQFLVNNANYEVLMNYMEHFEFLSMMILIGISIGVIVVVFALTQGIIRPLRLLANVANEVAEGNLEVKQIPVESKDEIGIVTNAFNQMIDSIGEYVQQLRENLENENEMKEKELIMQAHLKDAQLKYLQAQINPHFLFNTLNAGAQLAMMEGADKTCTFVENMADFFRYNVKKMNEDSSIEEELQVVDNYLYILNVRFGGEIHYSKEIEEQWMHLRVPSMILQPIVENAVNYGIRGISWEGHICLRVYEAYQYICISIADNGIGIEENLIKELLKGEEREIDLSRNSTGIGLGNVISRLQVYYSMEKVIEIKSEGENLGTEVIIFIPKE